MPIPPQFQKHGKKKKKGNPFAKELEGKAEPGDSPAEDKAEKSPKQSAKRKVLMAQFSKGGK